MSTAAFIKILPCVLKRKKLVEMYQKTLEMNTYLKESSAEKKIAYRWLSLQKRLSSYMIIAYLSLATASFFVPISKTHTFPLASGVLPKVLHKLPWNLFVYAYEFIIVGLRITTVASCDCYLAIFMCQICSELQIVGNAMLAIDIRDKQSIYRAIKKHKRALEYGQMICKELSSSMVIMHCGMSLGTCFAALGILYLKNEPIVFRFISIILIIGSEVLLLCYVGERIVGESLKVADCLENKFEEFLGDAASLKTISFMLLRAQRPLSVKVGENTIINLNLFRITLNKIFSCFVILKRLMAE